MRKSAPHPLFSVRPNIGNSEAAGRLLLVKYPVLPLPFNLPFVSGGIVPVKPVQVSLVSHIQVIMQDCFFVVHYIDSAKSRQLNNTGRKMQSPAVFASV